MICSMFNYLLVYLYVGVLVDMWFVVVVGVNYFFIIDYKYYLFVDFKVFKVVICVGQYGVVVEFEIIGIFIVV